MAMSFVFLSCILISSFISPYYLNKFAVRGILVVLISVFVGNGKGAWPVLDRNGIHFGITTKRVNRQCFDGVVWFPSQVIVNWTCPCTLHGAN